MRLSPIWLLPWVALACAPRLPSTTPLGEGPAFKAEAALRAKEEKALEAKAKKAGLGTPESPPPAAPPPPDAPVAPPPKATAEAPKPEPPTKAPGGKKPAVVVVYAGEYVGSDTSTYNMAGMERSEKDDKARTRVDGAGPEISVTFVDSGSGKDICTLKAQTTGKTGSFAPGQKCWATDGPGGTLTKGTASFEDKKLIVDADFDIQIGPERGQLHYHFEGTRK